MSLLVLRPLVAAAAGLLVFHGSAQALTDGEFQPANAAFLAASDNSEAAIDKAAAAFATLRQAEPANPLLLAYAGALESRRARTTILPWRKIGFAEDGMATIDKGLALLTPAHDGERVIGTPVTLLVKFTAANTFLAVPSFMNRSARGRKLLDEVLAHPALPTTPAPFREAVARFAAANPAAGSTQ